MKKITQKQAIFYTLYKSWKIDKLTYLPVWSLMGEIYCTELSLWGFVSYEVGARISEINSENPGLLERKEVTGKTGAKYYVYRISQNVKTEYIKDVKILEFYKKIKV